MSKKSHLTFSATIRGIAEISSSSMSCRVNSSSSSPANNDFMRAYCAWSQGRFQGKGGGG